MFRLEYKAGSGRIERAGRMRLTSGSGPDQVHTLLEVLAMADSQLTTSIPKENAPSSDHSRCVRCGKFYLVPPRRRMKTKHCSVSCRSSKVSLVCKHCGVTYQRKPKEAITSRFCSCKCKDSHPKNPETIEKNR